MGKVKAVWQAEQEKSGWEDTNTNEMSQVKHLKQNNDPWNLWDNDGGDTALNEWRDMGAMMAKWEEL